MRTENSNPITSYEFGKITIAGRAYTADVIIWPDRVRSNWWRKEGHSLCLEDLKDVLSDPPERLLVGRGYYGAMQVPEATRAALAERGIEVHAVETPKAVELWNEWLAEGEGKPRAVAAFHLTC